MRITKYTKGNISGSSILLLLNVVVLLFIGMLGVFSTTFLSTKWFSQNFVYHIIYMAVGLCFIMVSFFVTPKLFTDKIILAITYATTLIVLAIVLFVGTVNYGAQRWLQLGIFSIQPAEVAKLVIILITAKILSLDLQNIKILNLKGNQLRIFLAILAVIPIIIMIFLQKSLGNTLISSAIFLLIIFSINDFNKSIFEYLIQFVLGILSYFFYWIIAIEILILAYFLIKRDFRKFANSLVLFVIGILIPVLAYFTYANILEPYQRQRIDSFLNPAENVLQENWNREMSVTALASGQIFGKGFLNGNIVNSGLLPFPFTDFIFAALGEQFGFIGTVIIIILFILLFVQIFRIINFTDILEYKFISIGVIGMVLFNFVQHVGMNSGILPITGVPLPFISYGGSALISNLIAIAILNSILLNERDKGIPIIRIKNGV